MHRRIYGHMDLWPVILLYDRVSNADCGTRMEEMRDVSVKNTYLQ